MSDEHISISVIMPCRDEELTVGHCIDEAFSVAARHNYGIEVIVCDNQSTDRSAQVAKEHGATVVEENLPGYGHAIRAGIDAAKGDVIFIADCDMTYDLSDMSGMISMITDGGYDVVIGNRFSGGMEKGAMSPLHRIGVKMLSAAGRIRFKTDVHDFHCGIRCIRKDVAGRLDLCTGGMEFATEMIAKAAERGCRIGQIPVRLKRCPYERKSKLRVVRDGFRHLNFIVFKGNK